MTPGKSNKLIVIMVAILIVFGLISLYNRSITSQFNFLQKIQWPSYTSADYDQWTTQTFPGSIFGIDVQPETVNFATLTYGGVTQQQALSDISKSLVSQGFQSLGNTQNTEYTSADSSTPGGSDTSAQIPYTIYGQTYSLPKHVSHCATLYVNYRSDDSSHITVGCDQPR